MCPSSERGFSMLVVMFVLLIIALLGVTAATIGTTDAGTARAHSGRAQALLAAETGLAMLTASGDAATIEGLITAKDGTVTALPALDIDGDGVTELRPAFLVLQGITGEFVVEGQLRDESDRVISRARLAGRVTTFAGGDGYEGQVGLNPRSTGVVDERDVHARGTRNPF